MWRAEQILCLPSWSFLSRGGSPLCPPRCSACPTLAPLPAAGLGITCTFLCGPQTLFLWTSVPFSSWLLDWVISHPLEVVCSSPNCLATLMGFPEPGEGWQVGKGWTTQMQGLSFSPDLRTRSCQPQWSVCPGRWRRESGTRPVWWQQGPRLTAITPSWRLWGLTEQGCSVFQGLCSSGCWSR